MSACTNFFNRPWAIACHGKACMRSRIPADYVQFLLKVPADYVQFLVNIPADYVQKTC